MKDVCVICNYLKEPDELLTVRYRRICFACAILARAVFDTRDVGKDQNAS